MKNKVLESVMQKGYLKSILILIGMVLFLSSQTMAVSQGSSNVNLTWDSVYGEGYQGSSPVEILVKDKNGVTKATANTTTSDQGSFAVEAYDFTSANGQFVNIVSGDEVTVVAGTGSMIETDTISTNLTAHTSATLDKIYVRSLPNKSMYLQKADGGSSSTVSIQTDTNGSCIYDSPSDILPNDYFSVYYEDDYGNTVATDPIAPYGMVSISDDKVWGFHYPPETTATVDVYSDGIIVGSATGKTGSEGDFSVDDFKPQKDIKNGYKVAINCSSEQNDFFANLTARADFKTGIISGKASANSHIIAHVVPASGADSADTETDAQTNGNYSVTANPGLNDDFWVAAIHTDGNITQLKIVYGTQNTTIGSPALSAGDKGKDAGNIMIEENRPHSFMNTSGSNGLSLKILTEGVRFASLPQAIPTGVDLKHYQAAITDDSSTATWNVSGVTTSTAGSILLTQIKYDVDSGTAEGPVQIELGGECGVAGETLVNANIEPFKSTAGIAGTVLDDDSGEGLKGAGITLLKDGENFSEIKTSSTGSFEFPVVQKGVYGLLVSKIGYVGTSEEIDLGNGDYSKEYRLLKTNVGVLSPATTGIRVYESIESQISDLGYPVCKMSPEDLVSGSELKANLNTIFVNSSDDVLSAGQEQALKDFVKAGGSLYLSGMSANILDGNFPKTAEFDQSGNINTYGTTQTVEASILHSGLANYMNPGSTTGAIELQFEGNTVPWKPIYSINPMVEVYLSGDIEVDGTTRKDTPLAIGFDVGSGRVLYTSYYAGLNAGPVGEDAQKLIEYLTSSCLMAGEVGNTKAKLKHNGYDEFTVITRITDEAETSDGSFSYDFNLPSGKRLIVSLDKLSGEYGLKLKDPDGGVSEAAHDDSLPSALSLEVLKPQTGKWSFIVTPKSQSSSKNFYVVVVGTGDINKKQGSNNGTGGSSGGSSGGGSAMEKTVADQADLPTPGGLKAIPLKDSVKLTWNDASNKDVTGYHVYRAMKGDKEITRLTGEIIKNAEYVDSTAEPGKLYYYMVSSVNKAGDESPYSVFVASSLVVTLPELAFKDVPSGAWYKEYLQKLYLADIIDGYGDGTFKPQAKITRAEFCKLLINAVDMQVSTQSVSSFNDTNNHWSLPYIEAAREIGAVNGYGDGTFRPDNYISRAEIAKMVVETKGYPATGLSSGFLDCNNCWADSYIATLEERKVVSGYPGNLYKPQNFTTRAEACKVIWLMLEK